MFLKQMEDLRCGFVLAKYMPVENLFYAHLRDDLHIDEIIAWQISRDIHGVGVKSLAALAAFSLAEEKLTKLKANYGPHHNMQHGLYVVTSHDWSTPLQCNFVLHEWKDAREAMSPRQVTQTMQIVVPTTHSLVHPNGELLGKMKAADLSQYYGPIRPIQLKPEIYGYKKILHAIRDIYALEDESMDYVQTRFHFKLEEAQVYNFYGQYPNQAIILNPTSIHWGDLGRAQALLGNEWRFIQ